MLTRSHLDTTQTIVTVVQPALGTDGGEVIKDLNKRFNELHKQWVDERPRYTSNMDEYCGTPAYIAIINMGEDVIPLILHTLKYDPDHWFVALYTLTGASPVPKEHCGLFDEMVKDWLKWGKDSGYC